MIIYRSTVEAFLNDVLSNQIEEIILAEFRHRLNRSVGKSEIASWKNSMTAMSTVLSDRQIPANAGVAVEYCLAPTGRRIDMIISGRDSESRNTALIVELKQWSEADLTALDGIVRTFLGKGYQETSHPSYQAWSYARLLQDFNEAVEKDSIKLWPCAYLHNCGSGETIRHQFYSEYLNKAPAFLKSDGPQLRQFIRDHVKRGDSGKTIELLDGGVIRPSKNLADALEGMLQGNPEFTLIDDQKVVYETALSLATTATKSKKHVLIVEGGPGTGKSVVAVNLLVKLTSAGQVAQYVTKNAAPRAVYESKLSGSLRKSRINQLFVGSGGFIESTRNSYDTLLIDEAHRLTEKSGMFQNLGHNQVLEVIDAAKCSVFFIDEDQRVTFKDIGQIKEIRKWAEASGATVKELKLESQFRCNGSDGYLAWIDNTLQIRETANPDFEGVEYDFRVCDSPSELRDLIVERNRANNRARMVAGYCWEWPSKANPDAFDLEFAEFGFAAKWNLTTDGSLWILKPDSVSEVGCIHTCQGLEVDYVGVILGTDLVVRDGVVVTNAGNRAKSDASVKGYKSMLKTEPEEARAKADLIIKNTYRTLMTRGQKGCFVWSVDPETNEFLRHASARHLVVP